MELYRAELQSHDRAIEVGSDRVLRLLVCRGDWVMAGGCKTQMVSIKGLSLNDKLGPAAYCLLPGLQL